MRRAWAYRCLGSQTWGLIIGKGSTKGAAYKGWGKSGKGPGNKGSGPGKGSGKEKGQKGGKGTKGKKGKMFEVSEGAAESQQGTWEWDGAWEEGWGQENWDEGWGSWSWDQDASQQQQQQTTQQATKPVENLQLSALLLDVQSQVSVSSDARERSFADSAVVDEQSLNMSVASSVVDDAQSFDFQVGFRQHVDPLFAHGLQETEEESEWWLLDSGASVTVLSEQPATRFGIVLEKRETSKTKQQYSSAVLLLSCTRHARLTF